MVVSGVLIFQNFIIGIQRSSSTCKLWLFSDLEVWKTKFRKKDLRVETSEVFHLTYGSPAPATPEGFSFHDALECSPPVDTKGHLIAKTECIYRSSRVPLPTWISSLTLVAATYCFGYLPWVLCQMNSSRIHPSGHSRVLRFWFRVSLRKFSLFVDRYFQAHPASGNFAFV